MPEDPRIDVKLVRMALAYGLTTDPPSEIEFRAKWANGASVEEHLDATGCAGMGHPAYSTSQGTQEMNLTLEEREALFNDNRRLAYWTARRVWTATMLRQRAEQSGHTFEDAQQYALLGLFRAAQRFDPDRGIEVRIPGIPLLPARDSHRAEAVQRQPPRPRALQPACR